MANRRPTLDEQPLRLEGLEVDLAAERPMGTTHDLGGGSGRSMLWVGAGAAALLAMVLGTAVLLGDEPPMSPARPVLASGMADEVAKALGRFGAQRLEARLQAMPRPPMIAARPATTAAAVPVEPTATPTTPTDATPTGAATGTPAPVAQPTPAADVEPAEPVPAAAASDAKPFSGLPTIADDTPDEPPREAQPDAAEPEGDARRDGDDADPPAADAPVEDHTRADVTADEARPV